MGPSLYNGHSFIEVDLKVSLSYCDTGGAGWRILTDDSWRSHVRCGEDPGEAWSVIGYTVRVHRPTITD